MPKTNTVLYFNSISIKKQTAKKQKQMLQKKVLTKFNNHYDKNSPESRQPMEWKKIFANHLSKKKFISKMYKKLLHLNNNQKNKNK